MMVQKIIVEDEKLSQKVNKIVEELWACYPDGQVAGLNARHKTLSNHVGEIWPQIGYESRDDFFAAYGFEFVRTSNNMGGRPVSIDPEEIIEELFSRYEGVPKPKALGNLIYENPDLKGQIKTLQNKANELFGQSLAKELKDRGLLSGGRNPEKISDEEIQGMLEYLAIKYEDADFKPSSIIELKADNPEFGDIITAFVGRCGLIYGVKPKKKLVEMGIYPVPKSSYVDIEEEEVNNAIDELGDILSDLPSEEKPGTITELVKAYPRLGEVVKSADKADIINKSFLQTIGILAPTKAMLKKQSVRRVPEEDLLPLFLDVAEKSYIEPGEGETAYLPEAILGIDATEQAELRRALILVSGEQLKNLSVGDKVSGIVNTKTTRWDEEYKQVEFSTDPPLCYDSPWSEAIFDNVIQDSVSRLNRYVGATVVSKFEFDGNHYAQLEYCYLAELRSDTMIYMLREMGIVTDADIAGGMGWRFRIRKVLQGSFAIKPPSKKPHELTEIKISHESKTRESGFRFNISAKELSAASEGNREIVPETGNMRDEVSLVEVSAAEASALPFGVSEKESGGINLKFENEPLDFEIVFSEKRTGKNQPLDETAVLDELAQDKREAAERERVKKEQAELEKRQKEEAAKAKAEAEAEVAHQEKVAAQQAKISELEDNLKTAREALGVCEMRSQEIERLENQSKSLESYISGLGLFKGKEKKAKSEELMRIHMRLYELKEQNAVIHSRRVAVENAEDALWAAYQELNEMQLS